MEVAGNADATITGAKIQANAAINAAHIQANATKTGAKSVEKGLNNVGASISDSAMLLDSTITKQMDRSHEFKIQGYNTDIKQEINDIKREIINLLSGVDEQTLNDYFDENEADGKLIFDNLADIIIDKEIFGEYIELVNAFSCFLNSKSYLSNIKILMSKIKYKDMEVMVNKLNDLLEDKEIFSNWDNSSLPNTWKPILKEHQRSAKQFENPKKNNIPYAKEHVVFYKTEEEYQQDQEQCKNTCCLHPDFKRMLNSRTREEVYSVPSIPNYIFGLCENDGNATLCYWLVDKIRNISEENPFAGYNNNKNFIFVGYRKNLDPPIKQCLINNANLLHFILNCGSIYGINKICTFISEILDILANKNDCFKLLDTLNLNPYRTLINEINKPCYIYNTIDRLPECYKKISDMYKLSYFYRYGGFTNQKGQMEDYFNC